MSTKTSIKRIAAVAALALTLGGFSAVTANAVATAFTATNSVTSTPVASATATPGAAGTAITGNLQITADVTTGAATTLPITWNLVDPNGTDVTSTVAFSNTTLGASITSSTLASNVDTVVVAASSGTTAQTVAQYSFTPLMGGQYTWRYTVGHSTAGDTILGASIADVTNTPNLFVSGAGAKVAASGIGSSTVTAVTGGVAVIRFATKAKTGTTTYNLTTSGVGVIQTAANTASGSPADAPTAIAGIAGATDFSQGAKVTTTPDTTQNVVLATVASTVAGTQTLTWAAISSTTGAPSTVATVTITWTATASTAVTSLSTAFINTGAAYAASNGTTLTASATAVTANNAASANIGVSLNDAAGLPVLAQKLTVTIAGPGLMQVTPNVITLTGASAAVLGSPVRAYSDSSGATTNNWMIGLFADGTTGTSTVTIAVGSNIIATKTFTFTGSVAAVKATQNFSIAKASSTGLELGVATSNTTATTGYVPAITAEVTDANGNDVNGTLSCLSSDLTVISSCVIVADNNATYGAGTGFYNVDVVSAPGGKSGSTATVTVRYQKSDGTYISAAPLTFTLGGAIASTTATLDAATYTPGSPMQLTITAKDSAGNPTYDNQSIAYAISTNLPVGGALPSTAKVFAKGKYATSLTAPTLFAPSVSGPFTITVVGNDLANTATSVSAAVTGGESAVAAQAAVDAANEATDAANAATDAANNAMDSADAAQQAALDAGDKADAALAAVTDLATKVSAIATQIASLSALVKKIAAKVKA
jgi:hypothetical protein